MPSLLAYRDHDGLGDWLFAMHVLKLVNEQYPDIDITLSPNMKRVDYNPLIEEVVGSFGLQADILPYDVVPDPAMYDMCTGHMIYEAGHDDYVESMVKVFNRRTKLHLLARPMHYHLCAFNTLPVPVPNKYILMIGHGKKNMPGKDWGYANFNLLCRALVERGHRVVQIGMPGDLLLNDAEYRYFDVALGHIQYLVAHCYQLISIPNGLMVLRGMFGGPQTTIYCGYEPMERSNWLNQMKVKEPGIAEILATI